MHVILLGIDHGRAPILHSESPSNACLAPWQTFEVEIDRALQSSERLLAWGTRFALLIDCHSPVVADALVDAFTNVAVCMLPVARGSVARLAILNCNEGTYSFWGYSEDEAASLVREGPWEFVRSGPRGEPLPASIACACSE
ncbi:hypothetical protein ASA1KI_21590 [Opitutales bacterium ASA1]|nr:hypothetical protein ASA1KI_21590 [Opitutales bacterium ASA1]